MIDTSDLTTKDPVLELFLQGHQAHALPVVAQITGGDLKKILHEALSLPPSPTTDHALAPSTRKEHIRYLRHLSEMDPIYTTMPLPKAIVEWIHERRTSRTWTWATTHKALMTCFHALIILPIYYKVCAGLNLLTSPIYQQALKAAARSKAEETARQPKAMSIPTLCSTMVAETDTTRKAVLALMWTTTARVGCVLSLTKKDVTILPSGTIQVLFRLGKGAKMRGRPYLVHTVPLPPLFLDPITTVYTAATTLMFPGLNAAAMLPTFRLVDKTMEARSIRRGSLQAMAKAGTPVEVLMMYSGHTSPKTLFTYLNWGEEYSSMQVEMAKAGKHLLPMGEDSDVDSDMDSESMVLDCVHQTGQH
jgi:hypothetical protein